MGLYEQVDYDFSGLLHPQDLFGREYVTMGGVIDHHLTTTVQLSCKMSEKLVVMTNNRLFLVLGRNCAESTKFTFQRQSIPSCRSSPTTATWQVLGSFLFDTARFALTKTRWSTVVRPRIDHYWKLTTLQD